VIVDNEATSSHRYSLDGVTEVMERQAPLLVPRKPSSARKQSSAAVSAAVWRASRPPFGRQDAGATRKHGLRIHPGSGSKPWQMRRPCPLTATCWL